MSSEKSCIAVTVQVDDLLLLKERLTVNVLVLFRGIVFLVAHTYSRRFVPWSLWATVICQCQQAQRLTVWYGSSSSFVWHDVVHHGHSSPKGSVDLGEVWDVGVFFLFKPATLFAQ